MIDIVLASYNGQKYLREQVNSIQANFDYQQLISRFIIVDDGSTDNTLDIVKELQAEDPKIELLLNQSGQHGVMANFSFGLQQSNAEFIMLSDQDDIWLPEKITTLWHQLQQCSVKRDRPLLLFSDKAVVDAQLTPICPSYFQLKNIPKTWHQEFKQLCQQNVVSGCTVLFNRALLDKALPIPNNAYMHDWWLALIASRCGELVFVDKALIQYRQHENNTIGANKVHWVNLISQFSSHYQLFQKSLLSVIGQANAFKTFEKKHGLNEDITISTLANLLMQNKYHRFVNLCKGRVTRSHFLGRVVLLISLLLMKTDKK